MSVFVLFGTVLHHKDGITLTSSQAAAFVKRIGVISLPGQFNYGNRLQLHANIHLLQNMGYSVYVLYPDQRHRTLKKAKRFLKKCLGQHEETNEASSTQERLGAFSRFDAPLKENHVRSVWSLKKDYYLFFVGSDQVWNPDYARHNADWYFLRFARPEQRIALAPSIGLDELTSRQARWLARGVSGFPRLSVREQRGAELIKECSGLDAEVICDPTLVLTAEEWRAAADERLTPADPYVFTYLLGGTSVEAQNVLGKVTENGRIPVVALSDRQKPGELDAGPAEFISLIDNAEHVVTDSFHAAVFSSILQTPLTIVRREGGASMFSRLESLAKTLGIEHKVYDSPAYDPSRAGDYATVPRAIEREREKFMAYLKKCLNG